MEPYDWTQFTKRILINVPAQQAYLAWTIGEELERWFLKEAKFVSANGHPKEVNVPIQVGDTYTWRWFGWDGQDQGQVIEANGNDRLVFTFAGPCMVTVTFTQLDGATLVELVQKNIPTDDASKANLHVSCTQGWTFYMANLKSILEGGLDLRNKSEEKLPDAVNV